MITRIFSAGLTLLLCLPAALRAYESVSAAELHTMIGARDSLVLLDVRESEEYDAGHIDGAHLFPLGPGILERNTGQLPTGFDLAVYCGSGVRSSRAAAHLDTAAGEAYAGRVYNLADGLASWAYGVVTGGQDGPTLAAQPDSLAFGAVTAGDTATGGLTLYNRDSTTAAVAVFAADGAEFAVSPDAAAVLPRDSITLAVYFTPGDTAARLDTLYLAHAGAGRSPLAVPLSGAGEAPAIAGDIDSNGTVDIYDLLELLRGIKSGVTTANAGGMDVNADGSVDVLDLLELLKQLR